MKTISLVSAAIMALVGITLAGSEGWTPDFAAAKKQAAESNKDLLIDFTGSDWCGWCIKLNDEVFKHDAFKEGVKDTFVLVEIDSPRDKSKLSEETQKQNKELVEKYQVQGFPTILLTDADGRPYASTGYQEGGPEKYVTHLNELRDRKKARDEGFAAADKLEGPEKAKALVETLGKMELDAGLVSTFYGDILEKITAADPEDSTGFAKKAAAKKRIADFQQELQALVQKQDMDGALSLVDKTIAEGGFDTDSMLQVKVTRAFIFAEQGKFDDAIKALDDAKAFAPDSPLVSDIDQIRVRIQQLKKEGDNKGEAGKAEAEE